MLAAMEYKETDYTPCSFMLFFNERRRCSGMDEFVQKQLDLGLDAYVHVGYLDHSISPEAKRTEWVKEEDGCKYFCRKIDTPKGPLTQRVRQSENWPREGNFPIYNDYIVPRAEEVLVKPEQDLEKLQYLFGPFSDEAIAALREQAEQAKRLAEKHNLLQVGGWSSKTGFGIKDDAHLDSDGGVMGCDAMAWLSGYEDIMILSLTKPELIKEYAEIIHQWNMKRIQVYLDITDADIIWRRAWYETTEFWTPQAYKEIIAPTVKKEAELVHQAGKKYGYIITSAFLPLLDDMLDTGIDVLVGLDPEEGKGTDLNIVKEKFAAKKKAIWGGASGAITVEQGTAEETEAAVINALELLGKEGGFILSPVDNLRDDTENTWNNTQVFVDTWKTHRANY